MQEKQRNEKAPVDGASVEGISVLQLRQNPPELDGQIEVVERLAAAHQQTCCIGNLWWVLRLDTCFTMIGCVSYSRVWQVSCGSRVVRVLA